MNWKPILCILTCVLLCGCQSRETPTQKALDFRTKLLESGGCTYEAAMEADFGDRTYAFTVACDYDGTDAAIQVLQPEEIAGITATVTRDGVLVEFQDAELDFGQLKVSPVKAPWILANSWTTAYIASAGADGELERITCLDGYDDREITVDTWLDETGIPVHAELSYDGTRCLTMEISEFQTK